MVSGSYNTSKFRTQAGILVDASGYDKRFMEELQHIFKLDKKNGGYNPSDNLDDK